MPHSTRQTVADLWALKGQRQLTMLYVEPLDEAAAAIGAELEVVRVAAEISKRTPLLMLSMGSGSGGDGQYLFAKDVLGCTRGHRPRHAKVYRNFGAEYRRLQQERIAAFKEFAADVASGVFPEPRHLVGIEDREFDSFLQALGAEG
jgi:3-methyl-2-oxobutanoate hydroxymethyltransferase